MNKRIIHRNMILLAAILTLTVITFTGSGCRLLKRDKAAAAEKKTAAADKKADAEYEKAREEHYKHQTKDAKKMMKKTKKQAAEFNKPMKRKTFAGTKCK